MLPPTLRGNKLILFRLFHIFYCSVVNARNLFTRIYTDIIPPVRNREYVFNFARFATHGFYLTLAEHIIRADNYPEIK